MKSVRTPFSMPGGRAVETSGTQTHEMGGHGLLVMDKHLQLRRIGGMVWHAGNEYQASNWCHKLSRLGKERQGTSSGQDPAAR